jgi:predicted transcriptional regulator
LVVRSYGVKTTLNLDDALAARLKREAARRGRTMSELVEAALRLLFRSPKRTADLPELPSFDSGGALVDVADRSSLYEAMEGR